MKKITTTLMLATAIACFQSCQPSTPPEEDAASFTFTIEDATQDFSNLPGLQSFVLGQSTDGYWLIFGGRTNGFHGFGSQQNFPFKKANKFIYVYNTATHVLDSMSTSLLPDDLQEQYTSSNMEGRQVDNYLYACGGYGEVNVGLPDSAWTTHNIISRILVDSMVHAVLRKDVTALAASIAYDTSWVVRATGGELFKLPDGKFYLVVGHDFEGKYSSNNAVQKYLDSVHVFTLKETPDAIQIAQPFTFLSDNLPDSVTQFRRRDLVVAPNVLKGGKEYGISIYGGVFTYTSGCPDCNAGNPFRYPIYISGGGAPSYELDTSFLQMSNVYSAPNLQMYDHRHDMMYTAIFGGLGDTLVVNGDSAAFTKQVTTLQRDNKQNRTSVIYNPSGVPDYVGSEGLFIAANGLDMYKDNNLGILDYHKINKGKTLLGYIYGGIYSDSTQWNNIDTTEVINHHSVHYKKNITSASDKVFKVWIDKNK